MTGIEGVGVPHIGEYAEAVGNLLGSGVIGGVSRLDWDRPEAYNECLICHAPTYSGYHFCLDHHIQNGHCVGFRLVDLQRQANNDDRGTEMMLALRDRWVKVAVLLTLAQNKLKKAGLPLNRDEGWYREVEMEQERKQETEEEPED